ncbi:MAG: hypothetical protein ABIH99_02545 [Candidatus Micrarchaeota archaeon]
MSEKVALNNSGSSQQIIAAPQQKVNEFAFSRRLEDCGVNGIIVDMKRNGATTEHITLLLDKAKTPEEIAKAKEAVSGLDSNEEELGVRQRAKGAIAVFESRLNSMEEERGD